MPSESQPTYRKFSKPCKSFFRVAQFWAGPDHLLLVNSVFAVESYRRFYFKDIEALIIRPTTRQRTLLIVYGIALAVFGLLCWVLAELVGPRDKNEATIVFAVISGIVAFVFLVGFLSQLALGPTCELFLQMPTGIERLRAIDRLRPARKMRDRLIERMAEQPEPAPAKP